MTEEKVVKVEVADVVEVEICDICGRDADELVACQYDEREICLDCEAAF